jgi:hypothetical protein
MSINCGKCGASLPRSALDKDWPGCPYCAESAEARAAIKLLAQDRPFKIHIVTILDYASGGVRHVKMQTSIVEFVTREEAEAAQTALSQHEHDNQNSNVRVRARRLYL